MLLGHAMMVDRRTMDRPRGSGLATTLARQGMDVLNVDLRGHGESGPSARDGGRFAYDDFVRLDVPALVAFARSLEPKLPVVVVGHSLMGHAAILSSGLAPSHAPDAIVALGANLWTRKLEPRRAIRWMKGGALVAWAGATLATQRMPRRGLSLGSETEPWPYVRQFLRMYFRNHIASADGAIDYETAMGRVGIPVLSIASAGDRWLAHPDAVDAFMALLPPGRVEHRRVDGLDHMGLVTSAEARPVWNEIAQWIQTICAHGTTPRDVGRATVVHDEAIDDGYPDDGDG